MTVAGATFGIVGALAAFPRRLAAREVARQGARLRNGVTRRTTHVVFGRSLLQRAGAEVEARLADEHRAGRRPLSENGFLRLLGLIPPPAAPALARQSLIEQSRLPPPAFDCLALFDAFERDAEPYSFRDLILARKYAALMANGATWVAIARSVNRSGPPAALTAQSLCAEGGGRIFARRDDRLTELDGQLLLDLERTCDDDLDDLFAAAEAAEASGRPVEAAAHYQRCLALDPGDAVAAYNRANCLRTAGRQLEAMHDYARAIKLDPGFVEAWFNLAGLMTDRGRVDTARRHLRKAIALDAAYADAVFNLASLEFDAGNLADARRWWERYLELDKTSQWARTAAKGIRFVALAERPAG